jgi:hypothetical protein
MINHKQGRGAFSEGDTDWKTSQEKRSEIVAAVVIVLLVALLGYGAYAYITRDSASVEGEMENIDAPPAASDININVE